MKVPKRNQLKTFSVDRTIRNLGFYLARDFQTALADPDFCRPFQEVLKGGNASEIRSANPVCSETDDSYRFKCEYQMASLLKRYRFEKDLYSDQELEDKSVKTFLETQDRIGNIDFTSLPASTKNVLRYARIFIAHVLGQYCDDECRNLARFGKKASVGVPLRNACEAERWEPRITGTSQQIDWFWTEMSENPLVERYLNFGQYSDPKGSIFQPVNVLAMTLVPKTFKSLRSIMPNTTLGGYQSFGLGEMIRKRLRKVGYNISTLQEEHRKLARSASEHNWFCTADLSSASDSISGALLERLLPSDWFEILNTNRIGNILLPNKAQIQMNTFCTMGIGYTFPLQTLVFLSLLKAIEFEHFKYSGKRLISVYGDDMIYNKRIHPFVMEHFSNIGFVLNVDKTFETGPFRESCGGDYHRGMDVRPFQPRNDQSHVGAKTYEATLYKFINGLLHRWTEHEIPDTLAYLCQEVNLVSTIKLVPSDYPDDAGVRVCLKSIPQYLDRFKRKNPVHISNGVFRFSFLRFRNKLKEEARHDPYYWLRLRSLLDFDDHVDYRKSKLARGSALQRFLDKTLCDEQPQLLIWKKDEQNRTVRSKLTGQRLGRLVPFTIVHGSGNYMRQTGTSMF